MFNNPWAVVADTSSNLFVFDSFNYRIRKVPELARRDIRKTGTNGCLHNGIVGIVVLRESLGKARNNI
jgi:hypothetical protein